MTDIADNNRTFVDTENVEVSKEVKKMAVVGDAGDMGAKVGAAIKKAVMDGEKPIAVLDSVSDCPLCEAGIPKRKSNLALLATVAGVMGWALPFPRAKAAKEMVKCALSGCEVMTAHNGGYCCAEHCRKHRRFLRYSRKV